MTSPSVRRVAVTLQARIRGGDYPSDQWLPAERDLAAELGVHRRLIREAITLLAEEGWLVCRPRCRPLVVSAPTGGTAVRTGPGGNPKPLNGAGSRLVALIMWHGGFAPRATAQQRIFWGFNRALAQADYHGLFLDLGETIESEEENAAREAARLCYALEHDFAGIVFYPSAYRSNRDLIREAARRVPLVLIDRLIPGVETDYVGIDNLTAMHDATRHLLAEGHRRITLVTRSEPINPVQDRIAGYRAAMRQAAPPASELVIAVNSVLEWSLFDHLCGLPGAGRPTACLCINDDIALQVAERLRALGLRIPEDVSLVGFDDLVQTLPQGVGLSSVAQPFEEIGSTAAKVLLGRINDPRLLARHIDLRTTLSVRASSRPEADGTLDAVLGRTPGLDMVPKSC